MNVSNDPTPVVQDDTQPVAVYRPDVGVYEDNEAGSEVGGPGCGTWVLIMLVTGILGLVIVGLAGAVGWNNGLRTAEQNAQATHQWDIDRQVEQMVTDLAEGNSALYEIRESYLQTQSPKLPVVAELNQTATAVYLTHQPTVTPTPTETLPAESTIAASPTIETTDEPIVISTEEDSGVDLLDLLSSAQRSVSASDWTEAIETLDVIRSFDPLFEKARVDSLMTTALNARALALFRSGESGLAEAIALANRIEQFGELNGDVSFERDVATLYLNAKTRINTSDYANSIRYLNDVIALAPNYLDAASLRLSQYVAYGDALYAGGQPCQAVQQYEVAISLGSGSAAGKRDAAQLACQMGTPTPSGFLGTLDPNATIVAPIGQVNP
jgi:tetratricopeptide (TPR) repeat protein